jgi:hypothetical protein
MISGVRFVGMCDVFPILSILLILLVPYYTLPSHMNPTTDRIDCISVVTVATFEVPTGRSGLDEWRVLISVELSSRGE